MEKFFVIFSYLFFCPLSHFTDVSELVHIKNFIPICSVVRYVTLPENLNRLSWLDKFAR
ncbi:hypothetical protein VIM7927_01052 [Vibrio mangrovi]|uniref:Uncharacterized protein n=1 Tax=Vibrio mangrovi TaxID=474394 RepID=A0A1Y6IQA3_9VIBR|nr:hypothetical protein VIM7927_01052 [Vibrio mangrovi]